MTSELHRRPRAPPSPRARSVRTVPARRAALARSVAAHRPRPKRATRNLAPPRSCYELLGVKETSGPIPIKRAYRRLASKWHPDRCESGNVAKCREMFPKYANAYEVLSNAEMRKNYDYVMVRRHARPPPPAARAHRASYPLPSPQAHPYEFPGFFLKYSRPTYAPKSDLRLILLFVVFGGAAVQHYLQRAMHEQQVRRLKKDPRTRYNERVKEAMAKSGGGSAASPAKKSGAARGEAASTKNKGGPKGEALEKKRAEAEALVDAELASELPAPPVFADTMAVAVFKLPLTLCGWAVWTLRFSILRQAYGPAEQRKLTCRALGVSDKVFAAHSEAEQEELIGLELWVAEK